MANLNQIKFTPVCFCVCVALLSGCGGIRLQTPGEIAEQIKKGGQFDSEKRCDQYLRTSIEYQYCRQEARKVYDEVGKRQKESNGNGKLNNPYWLNQRQLMYLFVGCRLSNAKWGNVVPQTMQFELWNFEWDAQLLILRSQMNPHLN